MGTFGRMTRWGVATLAALVVVGLGLAALVKVLGVQAGVQAQELSPGKTGGPSVSLVSAPLPSITRGQPGNVDLRFHIASGYHINSNQPAEEFMIPTALHMDATTDIVIGKINYPAGLDVAFEFAPEQKLSVYSGNFTVDRKSTRLNSSHANISYAVFCLKKKKSEADLQTRTSERL